MPPAAQVSDILLGKVQVPDIVHGLLEPCRYGKAAVVRNGPVEQVEICYLVAKPGLEVAVAHGELIKVAEHGVVETAVFLAFTPKVSLHL